MFLSIHPRFLVVAVLLMQPFTASANRTDITGPAGSGRFGSKTVILPNGNIVVTDPGFDVSEMATDAGAVYLYSPEKVLISTLTGSRSNDQVGSGGIVVLSNGNYLVVSSYWNNGAVRRAGAVTWCSGITGLSGAVSAGNSLVGSSDDDFTGGEGVSPYENDEARRSGGVIPLGNGNYVVCSPQWDNGNADYAGAVTWGDGAAGTSGVISAANSLTGSTAYDMLGGTHSNGGITLLSGGDYVLSCPQWDNGEAVNAGAVIWCPGDAPRTGVISAENALVGTLPSSHVGGGRLGAGLRVERYVVPLANGNYVVCSPLWSSETVSVAGAVTWCPAGGGLTGPVTAANSLTGPREQDRVGGGNAGLFGGAIALSDGNYVVCSPFWSKDIREAGAVRTLRAAGAVTWCNGATGSTGPVTAANSLTGSETLEYLGGNGAAPLPGGHYVVCNPAWHGRRGAVIRVRGGAPFSGVLSESNSLTGARSNDLVGSKGAVVLSNGNYVVCSPQWSNGDVRHAGAVTWCSGTAGLTGLVSAANSLTGMVKDDLVGTGGIVANDPPGITALANGNYVVSSPYWDRGSIVNAGAVTWCSGATGRSGPVTEANSLTGSQREDCAGGRASTLSNRLEGETGGGIIALSNGNYVVASPFWDRGAVINAGAVTWCDGNTGLTGEITAGNSLTGVVEWDAVGSGGVTALNGGYYAVFSPDFNNPQGPVQQAGAVTLGAAGNGTAGQVDPVSSVIGSGLLGGPLLNHAADATGALLAVGLPELNLVALLSLKGVVSGNPFGDDGASPQVIRLPNGKIMVSFRTVPGAGYLLQRSADLQTWTEGTPVTADAEGDILWSDEAPPPEKVFYRLKVP